MRFIRALALAGVATLATSGLVACSSPDPGEDAPTSIAIAIPLSQLDLVFDPAVGGFGFWFLTSQAVYDPLVRWDPETESFGPWLAEEYEISEDGLTTSFTLREGVTFSDGERLTGEGVAAALNAAFTGTGYFGGGSTALGAIATATGDRSLEITTTKPTYRSGGHGLLTTLHLLPIVSPAAVEDPSLLTTEPVGSGPYLLDEMVPEVSATYVRNPDYWNPDAFDFDEVELVVIDDKVAAANALTSGQVDAAEIDFGLASEIEQSGLVLHSGPSGYTGLLIADRAGETVPPLGDVRVRRALNLALDRETIAEVTEAGFGRASSQPFGPGSLEYVEGGDDRYPYDPERAVGLLAEAGYPDGFALTILDQGGFAAIDYKPIVAQYLADIGVAVTWADPKEFADANEALETLAVPVTMQFQNYGNSIGMFEYDGAWTVQQVADPEFNELMELYSFGTPAEHDEVQPKLAEYVLDQAWYVPFSHPQVLWATRDGIEASVTNYPVPATFPTLGMFSLSDGDPR
jgi:peptide/nickel transport system substrate-binding protein